MIVTILLIAAVACFLLEAFDIKPKIPHIGWVGLAFFAAAFLVPLL